MSDYKFNTISMSDDTLGGRINCQGVQWRWVRGEAHACWVLCCESPLFCSLSFVLELPQVSLMMFHMPAEFYAVSPYFSLCFSLFLCLVLCLICPELHSLMLLSSMPQVTPLELHLSLFGWQWFKSKFIFFIFIQIICRRWPEVRTSRTGSRTTRPSLVVNPDSLDPGQRRTALNMKQWRSFPNQSFQ